MLTTTLSDIKAHSLCEGVWVILLKGLGVTSANKNPLPLERILEICGFGYAESALTTVQGHDGAIRLFSCYCARYSLDIFERKYPDDQRPRQAIEIAERFAWGKATREELTAAYAAASDAYDAVDAAARAAQRAIRSELAAGGAAMTTPVDFVANDAAVAVMAVMAAVDAAKAVMSAADFASDAAGHAAAYAAEAEGVERHAAQMAAQAAKAAAKINFIREFIRLCRLEGEYGEVDKLDNQK